MISIIVPAYNVENYIAKTLESLCQQSYKDIEIIVVNDGSTDNTLQTITDIAKNDSRIKVFDKENGGVTSARLYGIEQSSGDWIAFCDGDDTVEPSMYERLITNAEKYKADISHCGYNMVFPSRIVPYHGTNQIIEQDNKKGLCDLIDGSIVEPGLWNKLFSKDLINSFIKSNVMDYSIKINEDVLMNYYLFKLSKKSVFEDICLYNYVVRDNSAANISIKEHHLSDPLKVLEIIFEDTKSDNPINCIAKKRQLNNLINIATRQISENRALIKKYQKSSRKQLRKTYFNNMKNFEFSKFFKIKLTIATLMPDIFKIIHIIYSKLTGLDKIYEIK